MQSILEAAALIAILLAVVPVLIAVRALRRVELQLPGRERVAAEAVPAAIRRILEAEAAKLARYGFETCEFTRVTPIIRTRDVESWALVLWSESWRSFASLSSSSTPDPQRPVGISFGARLRDGIWLVTMNGEAWSVIGDDPRTEPHDAYVHGIERHFEAHCARLAALPPGRQPICITIEAANRESQQGGRTRIDGLLAARDLTATADGAFRFTWLGALRWAVRFRRRAAPYRRWLAEGKRQAAATPSTTPAPLLVDAFYRNREMENAQRGGTAKSAVLIGSLALFAVSFAGGFDTTSLAVLTGVLFFHELGHWVGMRAFGYRDTSIFFIPFFGAATSGENPDATATQRMLVYLLGPVPGLLIASALLLGAEDAPFAGLWAAHPDLLWRATRMLLWVNFFNLLPILPFDGGHIARLLIFGRHPWSEVAFRVVALIGLVAIALVLESRILLVVAGVSAIALPHTLRIAKLGRAMARERRGGVRPPERSLVESAFRWIEAGRLRGLPFATKYVLVRDALKGESMPSPGWAATLLLGALYLACLALGPTTVALPMVVASLGQ